VKTRLYTAFSQGVTLVSLAVASWCVKENIAFNQERPFEAGF